MLCSAREYMYHVVYGPHTNTKKNLDVKTIHGMLAANRERLGDYNPHKSMLRVIP